jgi:hypothetical protein
VVRIEAGGEVTDEIRMGSTLAPSTCALVGADVLLIGAGIGFGPADRRAGCVMAASLEPVAVRFPLAS